MSKSMYQSGQMDREIDSDVSELRSLMKDLPEPAEPHPAYWNNFLLRVHERIEAETSPKAKAWWSPALIWSSLAGTAALVLIVVMTGISPFGSDNGADGTALADGSTSIEAVERPVSTSSDMDLVPMDAEMASLIDGVGEESNSAQEHMILTAADVEMLDAIEAGDDDAILEAMLSEDIAGI